MKEPKTLAKLVTQWVLGWKVWVLKKLGQKQPKLDKPWLGHSSASDNFGPEVLKFHFEPCNWNLCVCVNFTPRRPEKERVSQEKSARRQENGRERIDRLPQRLSTQGCFWQWTVQLTDEWSCDIVATVEQGKDEEAVSNYGHSQVKRESKQGQWEKLNCTRVLWTFTPHANTTGRMRTAGRIIPLGEGESGPCFCVCNRERV